MKMPAVSCCLPMRMAQMEETDNGGYSPVVWIPDAEFHGIADGRLRIGGVWHFSNQTILPPLMCCPWCSKMIEVEVNKEE